MDPGDLVVRKTSVGAFASTMVNFARLFGWVRATGEVAAELGF